MKINCTDAFLAETIVKMVTLYKEAMKEPGLISSEEIELSEEQEKAEKQELIKYLEKKIFSNGENIENLWSAINNIDLAKINELKNNIVEAEYVETLIISSFFNLIISRNEKIAKFLFTETEVSEWHNLKTQIISYFLDVNNGAELNNEIIELLGIGNEEDCQKELFNTLRNPKFSDEFLISYLKISPDFDINKPIVISRNQDGVLEESSLLIQAISFKRLALVQYLVDKGADVNAVYGIMVPYSVAQVQGIKFFEALVASGRLKKEVSMNFSEVKLDNKISLKLSELYDVIIWKTHLSKNLLSFNDWFNNSNNGSVHSFDNLLIAYKKFSNIKLNYLKDSSPALKQVQDKYAESIIEQGQKISEKIKKYFSENWLQSLVVCKDVDAANIFNIAPEIILKIGGYIAEEKFKSAPLAGATGDEGAE